MHPNLWIRWFVVYMALAGGNFALYHQFLPLRIAHHILVTVILLYWLLNYGLPASPLLLPIVAVLVLAGVSCVYALDPRMARENLWHWFINALVFFLVIGWIREGRAETLFKWQFIAGGLIVGLSALEWGVSPGTRLHGPFFLTNLTGAYSAAMVIPTLAWAKSAANRKHQVLLALLGVGLVLVLMGGHNRGAWLSLAVGVVAFSLLVTNEHFLLAVAGVVAACIIGPMIVVMTFTSPAHQSGDAIRQDLWGAAFQMMGTHPLGVGPGLFGQAYREIGGFDDDKMLGAHNLAFHIGAELGIGGVVVAASVLVVFLLMLPKQRTMKQNAILAALIGVGAHMLVDNFPAQNFTFLVGLYAAYLVADSRYAGVDAHTLRMFKNGAVIAVTVFGLWLLHLDRAQHFYELSLRGDLESARVAAGLDPELKLYRMQAARLEYGDGELPHFDETVSAETDLFAYGLVSYGRVLR